MKKNIVKILILSVFILTLPYIALIAQEQKTNRPNIILIMADDLGYEGLGCNGGQSYSTPKLDQLASTGIRFEHCYSQPLCTPSRVQIMTGRYNFRNYKMFGYLDPGETTFGNILKDAGYVTCIAGKWQLGNGIEGPNHAGFDEYCLWQIYTRVAGKYVLGPRYADPKVYINGKVLENTKGEYGPDIFVDFINDFILENKDKSFFVYYPMVLTHDPFVPTPDSEEWENDRYKKDKKLFKDMVEYMDKSIGRIIDNLDELGLRENTLIIFIGDNGSPRQIKSKFNDGWIQGGKAFMTDAGTHVPLIANWPGTIPSGLVSDDLIDFSDFLPTLTEIGRTDIPEYLVIDGQSFYPQLKGEIGNPREWVFSHYWGRGRDVFKTREFVRDKRYKLYNDGKFFDILNDSLEENPIPEEMITEKLGAIKLRLQNVLDNMK
nr:sulfatase-like hydrolase/transferase [Bacteroidota bacterium]